MNERFIEFFNIGKSYPTDNGKAIIVSNFNLFVREGEFVCVIGHSGCGKSTVLSMLMGLTSPTEGGIILAGHEVEGPGIDRGVVFQSPSLLPWFTVQENVELAVRQARPNCSKQELRTEALKYLELVGLGRQAESFPQQLSAGMRQRVGIARAFALEPKVLLLDEPFSLLDALTRMELQDELVRLWEEHKKTVVMVTHDVDEALLLADRIIMMTNGPEATIGEIMTVPFSHPRTRETVFDDPKYYILREELITFLEERAYHKKEKKTDSNIVLLQHKRAEKVKAKAV